MVTCWFTSQVPFLFLVLIILSPPCFARDHRQQRTCQFDAIYQLGDSISDTGNLMKENPLYSCGLLPYGQTFFKNATGRCSNGLLIVDYLALSSRIPFLEPYLNTDLALRNSGVNFAVAGSTALPVEVLAEKKVVSPITNSSLSKQLDWMSTFLNGTCLHDEVCSKNLENALFMVGEIGGNDYNYALLQGRSFDEIRSIAPLVVQAIKDAVIRIVGLGATRVVVPGNFPIGCVPIYLTKFQSNDSNAYNKHHCLRGLNILSIHHNRLLKKAIEKLKIELPKATIVYGDYYSAYMRLLREAKSLGFDTNSTQKACCGIGSDYNFTLDKMCGAPGVQVCPNPEQYIGWDGVHFTQRAYMLMAEWLIGQIASELQCGA